MKKMITIAALAVISSSVYAYDYGYGNNQNDSNNDYQGSSGSTYQYDLSDPSDSVDYGVDVDAQMERSIKC